MAQIILTQEERKEITCISQNISDEDLLTFCAFDEEDMHNIINHKGISNMINNIMHILFIKCTKSKKIFI